MKSKKLLAIAALALGAQAVQAAPTFVELAPENNNNNISVDTTWTRDKVYILTDMVHVLPPAVLTIEPGTIVRGIPRDSGFRPDIDQSTSGIQDASIGSGTLVIARGAKFIAKGTPDDPIIFTSIKDPYVPGGAATIPTTVLGVAIGSTTEGNKEYLTGGPTGNNAFSHETRWGGVVMCGQAPTGVDRDSDAFYLQYDPGTNTFSNDTIKFPSGTFSGIGEHSDSGKGTGMGYVEGMPNILVPLPSGTYSDDEVFGLPEGTVIDSPANTLIAPSVYGGLDRDDDSGVVRFISNRYGGYVKGVGSEINGLTIGAMGTNTPIEWCETYNNADDGFEWFGGYNTNRYLFSNFNGDDGLDGDQGFNGTIQHAFVIRDNGGTRSGYGDNSATGRAVANRSDKGFEWDGSESNNLGITPNTDQWVFNFTSLGVGLAGGTGRQAWDSKESCEGRWSNGLVQGLGSTAVWQVAASNPTTGPEYGDIVYASDSLVGRQSVQSLGTNIGTEISGVASEVVSFTGPVLTAGGLDPRLAVDSEAAKISNFDAPTVRADAYPFSNWAKTPFGGAMRDNNMLKGWSILDHLGLLASDTVARPAVSLSAIGTTPVISFNADTGVGGRAVLYVIERSTDGGEVFKPIATISDNDGAGLTSKSGATFAEMDEDNAVGVIKYTDNDDMSFGGLSAGVPVQYRVIPQ